MRHRCTLGYGLKFYQIETDNNTIVCILLGYLRSQPFKQGEVDFRFFTFRVSFFAFRFSFFAFRVSLFAFRFSFFDIRTEMENSIFTFKILYSHSH